MALSRFWSYILICSILYILMMLLTGRLYTLGGMVNGKQDDALVVKEISAAQLMQTDTALFAQIFLNKSAGYQNGDTLYRLLNNGSVEICVGRQSADGIFPTCKNTIIDIWLPLIGYLTFFCGLLNLLNDSNAITKLA